MSTPILTTKLYIPPARPHLIPRPHLIEQLDEGLQRRLTLISAPAGFGKTTLVSEWVATCKRPTAWLSLDEGDKDPARFLAYLVVALQTVAENIGEGLLGMLQSPQPPRTESVLTTLVNQVTAVPDDFILVLDDYHAVDSKPIDHALRFLLDHQPPQMHLVIATREDPDLPLARLRARGQMAELRVTELRFTLAEAAGFLNQVMGLHLSAEDIAALETRTEGWIAGLQLAAISMQGSEDAAGFIRSFTGSHHFILDYLMEEVLQRQPDSIQTFLLRTSILERMCGSLCDALLLEKPARGQETLEYLEHANLFIIPLDDERHWYRYHHLFGELLQQRLGAVDGGSSLAELHLRASAWYEANGLGIDAFRHAAAANDVERAATLIEDGRLPLHLHDGVIAILDWLATLPTPVLDARPTLWWRYGSLMLVNGQTTGVEEKLDAADAALEAAGLASSESVDLDDETRNLIGRIAVARAVLALTRYEVQRMLVQSRRALEYLDPDNSSARGNAHWVMGTAYLFRGDRGPARQALAEAISVARPAGDVFTLILATLGLGNLEELDNHLHLAAETYQRVLQLAGDQPLQILYEAHLGLARIHYEWNDLEAAEQGAQASLQLARQYDRVIDRFIVCEVVIARIKLAQGDVLGASAILAHASQSARDQNFALRLPEVAAAQVLTELRRGDVAAADELSRLYDLPVSRVRVLLAQGQASEALATLEPLRHQAEGKGWKDERLKLMVLQVLAYQDDGQKDVAAQLLAEALMLAEPEGFIRLFVDEGEGMRRLLSNLRSKLEGQSQRSDDRPLSYVDRILASFALPRAVPDAQRDGPRSALVEPLSQRELEVLQLIAQGLSNHQIGERLFLALDTVKGHNRRIFEKLQVERRTEAVARARELGLL